MATKVEISDAIKDKKASKIITVEYVEESSVRISDYQYVKPRVGFVATVGDEDKYEDVFDLVVNTVRTKLKEKELEITKRYKPQK